MVSYFHSLGQWTSTGSSRLDCSEKKNQTGQDGGGGGVEDLELLGVFKKQHAEFPGVN